MKKSIIFTLLAALLFALTGCKGDTQSSSGDTGTYSNNSGGTGGTHLSVLSGQTPITYAPDETAEEIGAYTSYMNFNERVLDFDGSYDYRPFRDGIVYNGGELEFYVQFLFDGDRKSVKNMDAVALLFIDGYIQEFSVENDETALMHNVTVPNGEMSMLHFSCIPKTYDKNSEKHTIVAVILPHWQYGSDNFIKEAVMAVGREITLNTINVPEEDRTVQMKTREKTSWDSEHSELPFKQDGSNTNPVFHCFEAGETYCYLFCDGKLISHDGKYIFAANNKDENTVSYFGVSVSESDIGKPLYVLYVPKVYGGASFVDRTCNYLWDYTLTD